MDLSAKVPKMLKFAPILFGPMSVALAAMASPAVAAATETPTTEQVVRGFLTDVRSGRDPDAAARYFAAKVIAHQVQSEDEVAVMRTPQDYAAHVREFLATYGEFTFQIDALVAQNDLAFVRWRQLGHHLASIDGERPTGAPLLELTSAVYRVADGKIVEYWIQTDRKGMDIQLGTAASRGSSASISPDQREAR